MNTGQTLNDRLLAARHSIAGQGLAKAVCKATTEELIGPKKKHLDYLIHCTEEPNVSIPTLANLLLERTQNSNWVVVFKSLVTVHHLMCYGNDRFIQYLASSNTNFQLSNFLDKSGVHGTAVRGYDMSPFVRRYAKYLSEKSLSYRTVAFDFCKAKRGKEGGTLRQMTAEKLLKTLPILQNQLDALLDFEVTASDLNNGVINAAFMLMFRDLIRLFACYNDGIINLLEKYFDMNKKHARDALDLYKKFLIRMDRVAQFLKVAENVGIDRGDIPDLAKAPSSLLEALEAHLASLEGKKSGSAATTPTNATSSRVNVAAAVNILSSTSTAFGGGSIDEKLQQKLLAEEEMAMSKFKERTKATNPFAAPSAKEDNDLALGNPPNILDLFGMSSAGQSTEPSAAAAAASMAAAAPTSSEGAAKTNNKASDDLLQLAGNPFAAVLQGNNAAGAGATSTTSTSFASSFHGTNGLSSGSNITTTTATFTSDAAFSSAFGNESNTATMIGANFFGDILQPQNTGAPNSAMAAFAAPNAASKQQATPSGKLVSGDLDESLANLTSNLNLGAGQGKRVGAANVARGPPMISSQIKQQTTMAHPFM